MLLRRRVLLSRELAADDIMRARCSRQIWFWSSDKARRYADVSFVDNRRHGLAQWWLVDGKLFTKILYDNGYVVEKS